MKKYDVTLTAHYQKTVSVYAESPEQAKEKQRLFFLIPTLSTFPMRILSAAKPILQLPMRMVVKKIPPRMRIWRRTIVRAVRTFVLYVGNVCTRTGVAGNVLPSTEFG